MATSFTDFGTNIVQNQPRALAMGDYEQILKRLPSGVIESLNRLAQSGIFGEGGIEELMRSVRQQGGLARNRLARAFRQRSGRRLGPRAGAIDTAIANQIYAPSLEGEQEAFRGLTLANQQSKLQGLEGLADILPFLQSQVAFQEQLEDSRSGPGFMDLLNPAIDIASLFLAPPTGGGSVAANQARKQWY